MSERVNKVNTVFKTAGEIRSGKKSIINNPTCIITVALVYAVNPAYQINPVVYHATTAFRLRSRLRAWCMRPPTLT